MNRVYLHGKTWHRVLNEYCPDKLLLSRAYFPSPSVNSCFSSVPYGNLSLLLFRLMMTVPYLFHTCPIANWAVMKMFSRNTCVPPFTYQTVEIVDRSQEIRISPESHAGNLEAKEVLPEGNLSSRKRFHTFLTFSNKLELD